MKFLTIARTFQTKAPSEGRLMFLNRLRNVGVKWWNEDFPLNLNNEVDEYQDELLKISHHKCYPIKSL